MSEVLRVRTSELLYRTRGHDWDYGFLLQPEPLLGEGWYTLHRRIFANIEPAPTPVLVRGTLGIGLGHAFFATTFTDAQLRDYQGRPIAHYLVWLGRAAEAAPGCNFGPGLVKAMSPALESVFGLAPATLTRGETKPLDSLLRSRFLAALGLFDLTVVCAGTLPVKWLGTIAP